MSAERSTPSVRYSTIVADPPWFYPPLPMRRGGAHAKERKAGVVRPGEIVMEPMPYRTMTIDEISGLPVSEVAAAHSNLFLWATNKYVEHAFGIAAAWGFVYRQLVVWHKPPGAHPPFRGSVAPNAAEFLLVCRRGKGAPFGPAWKSNVVQAHRDLRTNGGRELRAHSAKPELFLDLIEQVSPGPYLELFARRQRLGWDTWGNEALEHVELSA